MRKITVILSLLLAGACLNAQDAAAIVEAARNRINSDTVSTRSRMVISARDGSTTERLLDQYSKDGPQGSRTAVVFQRPANVAGTRFLTMDTASGGEDRWIFLPALGKVRRIASSESGGSFMGTDFSYDDISLMGRDAGLDTHTILREEPLDGEDCHVIQSTPRNSSFPYAKIISWIGGESGLIYKCELYDRRGTLVKVMEMSAFREIQNRVTPTQTRIATLAAGTSTTIYMDIIKYDDPIPEAVFSTAWLETGRVR